MTNDELLEEARQVINPIILKSGDWIYHPTRGVTQIINYDFETLFYFHRPFSNSAYIYIKFKKNSDLHKALRFATKEEILEVINKINIPKHDNHVNTRESKRIGEIISIDKQIWIKTGETKGEVIEISRSVPEIASRSGQGGTVVQCSYSKE